MLPEHLAVILRSSIVLAQTRHMMTGNTHARVTPDDAVSIVIPVPPPDIQVAVAKEWQKRQDRARKLRAEADAEWERAKAAFEAALLGGSG